MKIKNIQDGKIITLSSAFDSRAKVLNIVYFILFSTVGFSVIHMALQADTLTLGIFLFIGIFGGVYLFAAYRFINKSLQTEQLIVTSKNLTISRTGFLNSKKDVYNVEYISNFKHLDKPQIAEHPLAGKSFDYLGFQTSQQVISEMHGDNRLSFEYNNKVVTFGENVYSWTFEELQVLFSDITGHSFQSVAEAENNLYSKE